MNRESAQSRKTASDATAYCRVVVEAARIGAEEMVRLTGGDTRPATTGLGRPCGNAAVGRVVHASAAAVADGVRRGERVAVHRLRISAASGDPWTGDIDVPPASLCPVPPSWSLSRALLLPDVALAARAIRASSATPQHRAATFGSGLAALSAIAMLSSLHPRSVVAVADDGAFQANARELGASAAFTRDDIESFVAADSAHAVDRALCFDGDNATLAVALRSAAHMGAVVVAGGISGDPVAIPDYYREIIIKETSILGVFRPAQADWAASRDVLSGGTLEALEDESVAPLDATTPARLRELLARGDAGPDQTLIFSR